MKERLEKSRQPVQLNWSVVKDWRIQTRYNTKVDRKRVLDMLDAVTDRDDGILAWLERAW